MVHVPTVLHFAIWFPSELGDRGGAGRMRRGALAIQLKKGQKGTANRKYVLNIYIYIYMVLLLQLTIGLI